LLTSSIRVGTPALELRGREAERVEGLDPNRLHRWCIDHTGGPLRVRVGPATVSGRRGVALAIVAARIEGTGRVLRAKERQQAIELRELLAGLRRFAAVGHLVERVGDMRDLP
jgi:hypothetical protein